MIDVTIAYNRGEFAYCLDSGEQFICSSVLREFGILPILRPTITLRFSSDAPSEGVKHCEIRNSLAFWTPFWEVVYTLDGVDHRKLTHTAFEKFLRKNFSPDQPIYITLSN